MIYCENLTEDELQHLQILDIIEPRGGAQDPHDVESEEFNLQLCNEVLKLQNIDVPEKKYISLDQFGMHLMAVYSKLELYMQQKK